MQGSHEQANVPHDVRVMRTSMVNSPQHYNVNVFLAPLIITGEFPKTLSDARKEYLRIVEAAVPALAGDPALRSIYNQGTAWVSRAVHPNYLRLYNHFKRREHTPLDTFVAVTYLRALRALIANDGTETTAVFSGLAPFLRNVAAVRRQAEQPIDQYGPDFLGHLIVEAEARANEDEQWATSLDSAEENFRTLEPEVTPLLTASFGASSRLPWSTEPDRIPVDGEPADSWWKIPAMVSLSCVYLRCATEAGS